MSGLMGPLSKNAACDVRSSNTRANEYVHVDDDDDDDGVDVKLSEVAVSEVMLACVVCAV